MFFDLIKKIVIKLLDLCFGVLIVYKRGVLAGDELKVRGKPIVQISDQAKILIGDNVTLNSRNYGYHVNMHSSVKLVADRVGAVIKIGDNTRINGACLHAYNMVEIGNNCLIAANVQILDANGHEPCFENPTERINTTSVGKPVIIEDNVWIGLNTIILPGVRIGQGSIIGANSVVSCDVPPMVVFAGNPGKIVKRARQYD